jgi:translation initiation factor 2D
LWVKFDGEALFPTVYTLWKNPGLLPILHTHPPVIEKLQNGADLMIPGMVPPFPEAAKKGALVGIASSERPGVPVCVGVCEIDVAGLEKVVGERGKAVRMVHWVGDEIFNHGGHGASIPKALDMPEGMVKEVTEGVDGVKIGDDTC